MYAVRNLVTCPFALSPALPPARGLIWGSSGCNIPTTYEVFHPSILLQLTVF